MKRRTVLGVGLGSLLASRLAAGAPEQRLDAAAGVLAKAAADGQVEAATLCVRHGKRDFARAFGASKSIDDMFLLGSISKPICVAALMTLYDRKAFRLDDPAKKFIPDFTGGGREKVTVGHLLTHVSGLPDQLPENATLRSSHAGLAKFVEHATGTPLSFEPGSRYQYSSMGILLATEIGQRISRQGIHEFVDKTVFQPLEMKHSALGLGRFKLEDVRPCQTDKAAPESGAGDPQAKEWDWNSPYWRKLGAPWGGVHASAPDVARFLSELLHPSGKLVKKETAQLMVQNHNPKGLTPRGLGFAVGASAGSPGCSGQTFGHTGSTGTLAWADPASDTICVVLTTLPGRAVDPHPRKLASDHVAKAID